MKSQQNQKKLKRNLKKGLRIELLIQKLLNNLPNKDYLLVLVLDLAKQVELMVIFCKENNFNSIQKKLIKERNDCIF